MAESAWRSQLRDWTNRGPQPTTTSSTPFFSRIKASLPWSNSDYVRLPISESEAASGQAHADAESSANEPGWFTPLGWYDRILIFAICLLAAAACFALCFAIFPVLALKPRKFALLWSLGSLLFVISFGALQGPLNYARHLTSMERLPFTLAFFGSIIATLICALSIRSTILTIIFSVIQLLAALWYTVSYFPMGTQGLRFASRLGAQRVSSWVNS